MKQKISGVRGFTLVELLIVIALIAILSVAVLATINPIEQTNKARDAKFKNDGAEVLGAMERYYASQNVYPWNVVGDGSSLASTESGLMSSSDPRMGVVASAGGTAPNYAADGVLIVTSELKSSFRGKEPFAANSLEENRLYVYHNANTNSNYVCYHPKAVANRTGTKTTDLKCLDLANTLLVNLGAGCATMPTWTYVPSATVANVACVPEGNVN